MKSEYFSPIKNSFTIIVVFLGLVEIALGSVVIFADLSSDFLTTYTYFIVGFPVLIFFLFAFVLIFRPHHFYSPRDYRSDENYLKGLKLDESPVNLLSESESKEIETDEATLHTLVNNLNKFFCVFLLKVANKPLTIDELYSSLAYEMGYDETIFFSPNSPAFGYFLGLSNFKDVLYTFSHQPIEGEQSDPSKAKMTINVSPPVLLLVAQRLGPKDADGTA